jgi:putative methionine-R-sulfoxide reductase with GAF domain
MNKIYDLMKMQVLLDAIPFYVMLVDAEHRVLLVNKAIQTDLNLDPKQIVGEYCPKAVHGLEEPYPGCPLEEALKKGHGIEREFFNPETSQWINSAIYPTGQRTQEGREIFIHFISDITEMKRTEEEIRRNYDIQTVINALLRLSLENILLKELLKRVVDLVLSIPWLAFESRCSIFLIEDKPEVLVMKSQRGLSKPTQKKCARIPIGKCLCGQAALTQEIQFADHLDERHEILYEGITSHGHYCVPIVFSGKTLGVINLYLREGHCRDQREEEFLTAVASTLAGIIELKQTDQALKTREKELEIKTNSLEEMNSALKVLLKRREEDRKELEEKVYKRRSKSEAV